MLIVCVLVIPFVLVAMCIGCWVYRNWAAWDKERDKHETEQSRQELNHLLRQEVKAFRGSVIREMHKDWAEGVFHWPGTSWVPSGFDETELGEDGPVDVAGDESTPWPGVDDVERWLKEEK